MKACWFRWDFLSLYNGNMRRKNLEKFAHVIIRIYLLLLTLKIFGWFYEPQRLSETQIYNCVVWLHNFITAISNWWKMHPNAKIFRIWYEWNEKRLSKSISNWFEYRISFIHATAICNKDKNFENILRRRKLD